MEPLSLVNSERVIAVLEDTLVIWTTEFGRMPSSQAGKGRDHNPFVYTNWMCGAGVKGGVTCGVAIGPSQ
jgi:uncharacterized protein (DUF1501 family)